MDKKFLISLFFMSSLAYGMDHNEELLDAVSENNLEGVILALKKGADIEYKDKDGGYTPLFEAAHDGYIDLGSVDFLS